MNSKEWFIDHLATSLLESEHTQSAFKELLKQQVGPRCEDSAKLADAAAALQASQALNDKAEGLLDKILCLHARGTDALRYTPSIDELWSLLKTSREKQGRPKPVAN